MPGQLQTVLIDIEARPKTDAAAAAFDALDKKSASLGRGIDVPVIVNSNAGAFDAAKTDAKSAGEAIAASLNQPIKIPPVKVPPIEVPPVEVPPVVIPPIKPPTIPPIQGGVIEKLEADLKTFAEQKKKAFNAEEAAAFEREIRKTEAEIEKFSKETNELAGKKPFEGLRKQVEGLKEGLAGIGTISIGTALGDGIKDVFSGFIAKAREADNASDQLSVAIAKAGKTGAAAQAEIARLGTSSKKIADEFALPQTQVTALQATIAGFGGVTGKTLDGLTETALGASQALGLAPEAIARMIARGADPEAQAALGRLGIVFDKNASAAGRLAAINAKLGPSIQAAKDSTQDAIGNFDRLKNTVEEAAIGFASKSFEALAPIFQALLPAVETAGDALSAIGEALGAVIGFVKDNAVSVGILAAGITAYAVATNAAAIGTAIATTATGAMTAAQAALNVVMEANPIGLIVVAVAALAAGVVYAYKHFEGFRNVVDTAWSAIKRIGLAVWEGIKFWAQWLNPIGLLVKGFQFLYEKIEFVHDAVDTVVDTIKSAGSAILSLLGINDSVDKSVSSVKESAKAATDATDALKASTEANGDAAKSLEERWRSVVETTAEAFNKLKDSSAKFATDATTAGASNLLQLQTLQRSLSDARAKGDQEAIASLTKYVDEYKQKVAQDKFALQSQGDLLDAANRNLAILKAQDDAANGRLIKGQELNDQMAQINARQQDQLDATRKLVDLSSVRGKIEQEAFEVQSRASNNHKLATDAEARLNDLKIAGLRSDLEATQAVRKYAFTKLELQQNTEKQRNIELQIEQILEKQADTLKKQTDEFRALADAEAALTQKEIEVGIRPKEDFLPLLREQIVTAQREVDSLHAKRQSLIDANATVSAITQIDTEIAQSQAKLLGLQVDINNKSRDLEKASTDARIANIDNEYDHDRAVLDQKLAADTAYFDQRRLLGGQLTQQEQDLENQIRERARKDRAAIDKKELDDKVANLKEYADQAIAAFSQAFSAQQKLSDVEVADKRLSFEEQQTDLEKSLGKGQISYKRYQVELAKLNKERGDFENQQNEANRSAFSRGIDSLYKTAIDALGKYLVDFAERKAIELLIHTLTEEEKTAATAGGSTARIASDVAEEASTLAVAAANGVAAAAAAVYNAIASLPFPLDLVAGAASAGAVVALIGGLTGAIGFKTGGLGLVGEGGVPEIIGPTKDFSQFATQLVLSTAKQTAAALSAANIGGGNGRSGGRTQVDLRVQKFGVSGRDLKYTFVQENLVNQTERFAALAN
jgi:hypothetical protein